LSVYCVANVIIMAEWYYFTALTFVSMLRCGLVCYFDKKLKGQNIISEITKELQNDYKTINFRNLNYILVRIKLKISHCEIILIRIFVLILKSNFY